MSGTRARQPAVAVAGTGTAGSAATSELEASDSSYQDENIFTFIPNIIGTWDCPEPLSPFPANCIPGQATVASCSPSHPYTTWASTREHARCFIACHAC